MLHTVNSLKGYALAARDGDIGKVRDIYLDSREWVLRYVVVNTGAWLFGREVLIPPASLGAVSDEQQALAVDLTKDKVRDAPEVTTQQPVSQQQEISYHDYYALDPYWGSLSPWIGLHADLPLPPETAELPGTDA